VLFGETGSPTNIAPRLLGPSNPSLLRESEDGRSSEASLDFHSEKHLASRRRRVQRAGNTRSCLIHRPHVPRTIDALPCDRRRAADCGLSRPFARAVVRDCRHRPRGKLLEKAIRATNSAIRSLPPDCSRTYTTRRLDRTKVMTE
jgi:hypothetical protein